MTDMTEKFEFDIIFTSEAELKARYLEMLDQMNGLGQAGFELIKTMHDQEGGYIYMIFQKAYFDTVEEVAEEQNNASH
jgi:hypothetical protein